jgi:hypothetical protein
VDPYRGELVRLEPRALVAEAERPPRGLRVRAWSDGTTRLRLGSPGVTLRRVVLGIVAAIFVVASFEEAFALLFAAGAVALAIPASTRVRIEVTRAAVLVDRRGGQCIVRPLSDVSTVVVSGSGDETRLDLQCGRERIQFANGLDYDEATLRWIAQRLRRALEAAR